MRREQSEESRSGEGLPAAWPVGIPAGYEELLADVKSRVRSAQTRAALAVNRELILLYWEIGKAIVERQERSGWGDAVLERLSLDLIKAFPEVQGFSRRNLYRMRALYLEYRSAAGFVPQAVAQIPWGHNVVLLEKVKDPEQRLWYAGQTTGNGWSRAVLVHQIETDLYGRQAQAEKATNFAATLPGKWAGALPAPADLQRLIEEEPSPRARSRDEG